MGSPVFHNCHDAIRFANAFGRRVVGYKMSLGWTVYDPTEAAPADVEPEFFCTRNGVLPVPLNDTALEIFLQMMETTHGSRPQV